MQIRASHENEQIKKLYEKFYGEPLSELAEQMLHTMYHDRSEELGQKTEKEPDIKKDSVKKYVCSVCGYVHEGEQAPEECPVCHVDSDKFILQEAEKSWAAEHAVGAAEGVSEDILSDLRANFEGKWECILPWPEQLTGKDIRKSDDTTKKRPGKKQITLLNLRNF